MSFFYTSPLMILLAGGLQPLMPPLAKPSVIHSRPSPPPPHSTTASSHPPSARSISVPIHGPISHPWIPGLDMNRKVNADRIFPREALPTNPAFEEVLGIELRKLPFLMLLGRESAEGQVDDGAEVGITVGTETGVTDGAELLFVRLVELGTRETGRIHRGVEAVLAEQSSVFVSRGPDCATKRQDATMRREGLNSSESVEGTWLGEALAGLDAGLDHPVSNLLFATIGSGLHCEGSGGKRGCHGRWWGYWGC